MNIKDTLSTLLPGVDISEEFVTKLSASIEAAIAQRVEEETKAIADKAEADKNELMEKANEYEQYANDQIKEVSDKANAYAEYVVEEMTRKVDDYCEYVVEKFIKENKEQLVESVEYARMSKVLNTIREAFETNFFQLNPEPASKSLETQLEERRQSFNELFEEHRLLKRQIEDYSAYVDSENRKTIFNKVTEGLADTQKERLEKLVEKSNFNSIEEYEAGVKMMVEELQVLNSSKPLIKEEKKQSDIIPPVIKEDNGDRMKAYLARL